jgi:membrane protein implicated in regulation of membrane protease activity
MDKMVWIGSHPLLKKFLVILGLVVFFAFDEVLLIILFFKIGFPSLPVAVWAAIVVFVILLNVSLAAAAYRVMLRRPATGADGLVGATGVVLVSQGGRGKVEVRGEHWDAEFEEDLNPGDEVRVRTLKGLTLVVESSDNQARRD